MKNFALLILFVVGIQLQSNAQITYPDYALDWYSKDIPVTKPVMSITDSIYRTLSPGASVKLSLLSDIEDKLPELERARISYGRAESLMNYFRKQRIPQKDFEVEMVPFHQPHRLLSSEITSRSYRSFMSRKAESYFLIHRSVAHVLSQTQLTFDAGVQKERETFSFNAKNENIITLASGTEFKIPANTFVTKSGHAPKGDQITANISEYKNSAALVLKSMTTTCNGQMLQSNGMWHIEFAANGEPLQVASGKQYAISVGMEGKEEKMQVFTGQIKNGMIDWKLENDGVVNKVSRTTPIGETVVQNQLQINNDNIKTNELNWNDNRNLRNPNLNNQKFELNQGIQYKDQKEMNEAYNKVEGVTNHNLYELKLNDVGWINCDAFVEAVEKTDLTVQCDTTTGLNAMLVFTKRKSVLPGYACVEKGVVKFTNIPVGETAILVVFKKRSDGSIIKYSRIVNPGNDKNILAALKPSTAEKLSAEINGIISDN